MRAKLLLLSFIFLGLFTYFSYTVAKETYQKFDFDSTVKLQDHISRKYDGFFSYFSLLGSVEITMGFCLILAILYLFRGLLLGFLGWLIIFPATAAEVFGKLVLFHPGPPALFHRSVIPQSLPSFYVHTDFSYPSGHVTRTFFIVTILICLLIFPRINSFVKFSMVILLLLLVLMMALTRVYLGEHWLSDVLGGGLLGMGMGLFASVLILPKEQVKIASFARGR